MNILATTAATAVLLGLAVPAADAASSPAPVSNLQLSSKDSVVFVDWTPSPDTTDANVCWSTAAAPSTPTDPNASCSGTQTASGYSFAATKGQQYGVSVFSYDSATDTYGSPVSGSIVAEDAPPLAPVHLSSSAGYSRAVNLYWQDPQDNDDTVAYIVDWQRGTAAPPVDASSGHVTTYPSFWVDGLAAGVVYTFAVYVRDSSGQVGPAAVLRASTRTPNTYLVTDDADLESPQRAAYSAGRSAAVTMSPDAHLRLLSQSGSSLYYQSREPGSTTFDGETRLAHNEATDGFMLASSSRGHLLAVWPTAHGLHYRFRTAGTWQTERSLTGAGADLVFGVTYDGRHAHVLTRSHGGHDRALWLYTYSGSRWHSSRVPGTGAGDVGAMTQDPRTAAVVLVDRHQAAGASRLRVATMSASASRVSGLATWAKVPTTGVVPTSVASVAGTITIGVQRDAGGSADGPYLLRGHGGRHSKLVRVRGTSAKDESVVVTALQRDHVVITWRRMSGSWSPDDIGVWASQAVRSRSGHWQVSPPKRWTTSAYDFPAAAFRSDAGHRYVLYATTRGDVTE